jgi:hypothetical protein
MKPDGEFPRLTPENHRLTSPPTVDYICITWAKGDFENWWQLSVSWPIETLPEDYVVMTSIGQAERPR